MALKLMYITNDPRVAEIADQAGVDRIFVDLETVGVDENAEVAEFIMCSEHECFPALTFFDLTVAEDGEYTVVLVSDLSGKCHTASSGNTKTERTGCHINTGSVLHIGVTLKIAVCLTESLKILLGNKALSCKSSVKTGCGVTL